MTQETEKELVLGNKQLISLFFVIVALCGVFFAMGYMMGRNTAKPAAANLEANAGTPTASAPASAAPQPQDSEPPRQTTEDTATTSPAVADSVQSTPPPSGTAPPATAPTRAATPVPAVETKPALDTPITPEPGAIWLQVTALRRTDADNLVKTLREQNFPAALANSSKPDLFRVMVGPYHQTSDVADAKARLKALGFADAFVQK